MTATVNPRHARVPLWRDVRVLQWLFQLLVVAMAAGLVIWLYGNYTTNSSRQGIPTSLDFLDNPASGRVLEKLGFKPIGITAPRLSCARGTEAQARMLRLSLTGVAAEKD